VTQLAMFDLVNPAPDPDPLWTPVARNIDPQTCRTAAEHAARKAGTNRALALRCLAAAGAHGLTDFELAERTGTQQTSIGKRRGELVREGYVEATTDTRPAPSGSPAMVWRVTARGAQRGRA
jgi:hypothetical protein